MPDETAQPTADEPVSRVTWASSLSGGDRQAISDLLDAVAALEARVAALEAAGTPSSSTTSTRSRTSS